MPDLVSLSERYGMSPAETASALSTACAPTPMLVRTVHERCEGELAATVDACAAVLSADAVMDAVTVIPW